ncbi:MAG: prepilin peptidase [Candidatus Acidulodesulfobacterium ferriphilum]|uniref:Prepilin leader peptidase/N-methyltransferase n=1 Tax=Candidatus Acidulodesulfobacterium ferriphilum TaxID=2597223 RepID=A0A519BAV6_9DELT|nr:MAG: prepilin peptidase [Candidatus Acidulodesulfobacterium ferriphilum]
MVFNSFEPVNFLFSHNSFFLITVFLLFIGLSIGSFLNVVIFRLPVKLSIIYPPSKCPDCGSKIKFYDNIPVLSYIILSGKCRKCGHKISPVYPMVELLTALIFYSLFIKYFYNAYFFYKINILNIDYFKDYLWARLDYFITYSIFVFILIPIAFIDLFHQIIPDILNVLTIILGFVLNILLLHKSFLFPLYGFLGAGLFFYFIAFFYEIIKKREGLGGGDIKLIAGIGSFIGLPGAIFTIFAGSVFALIGFFIAFIFFNSYSNKKIPFGPFLSLAAVLYAFYGRNLLNLYIGLIKK